MKELNQSSEYAPVVEIRIEHLNNDKTRRIDGSDRMYSIYFDLSGVPPRSWGTIFEGEWKLLNVMHADLWEAARVDKNFLVMVCPLDHVVSLHLPFLRKAVATTNIKYAQFAGVIAKDRLEQKLTWERERGEVRVLARSVQL